ncbi:hypothetical protein FQR65_LT10136 [Abscondita terminalis]|nr:hypothetical protein FQR65_LT10136 [Abscondita terminalis]
MQDTNKLIENLTVCVTSFIVCTKVGIGYCIRTEFKNHLKILEGNKFCSKAEQYGPSEMKLLKKCSKIITVQTVVMCATVGGFIIMSNLFSIRQRIISDSGWDLPFGGFPFWNTTYSPNYELALMFGNCTYCIVFTCHNILLSAVVAVMVFLTYQCKILQIRVKTCIDRSMHFENVKGPILSWSLLENSFKECVNQLTYIMTTTQKFQKLFSFFFLIDFVGFSVIISLCVMYLFTINSYNFKFVQITIVIVAAVTTAFFTNYWGSELEKEYVQIGHCCYELDFVGTDLGFQKSLMFMIQQTQTPVRFTVGGFGPLSEVPILEHGQEWVKTASPNDFENNSFSYSPRLGAVRIYTCGHAYSTSFGSKEVKNMFDLETKLLRTAGLLGYKNETLLYRIYFSIVLSIVGSSSLCTLYLIFIDNDDTVKLIENFTIGVTLLIASTKVCVGYYIRFDLNLHLKILTGDKLCPNPEKYGTVEVQLFNECSRVIKKQTIFFCSTGVTYLLVSNIPTVKHRLTHDSGWFLPYGGFPLWNTTYSPNFEFALIIVNFSNVTVFVCYMILTLSLIAVLVFLSYQCKILQTRVKTCLERSLQENILTWSLLEANIKDCIKQLTYIMNVTGKFEKLFSRFFLIDFVGLSVIIASCLLYGFMINSYDFKFAQMLTIVFAAIITELFTTYWGSEIVKQYLEIGICCYELDFVGVDLRFQKYLCVMIQQTQRPLQFTIGGFSPLTMRTFLVVMKGAYSCFTFLHQSNSN